MNSAKSGVAAAFLAWIALICMGCCGTAAGADVTFKRHPGNLEGTVLIVSINRVPYGGNGFDDRDKSGAFSFVKSADDCEQQCSFVSGCTGWTYCSKPGGCGTGCKAYHVKIGPGRYGIGRGCTPVGEYYSRDRPIRDDFTAAANACTATDGWPQHTCTVKTGIASPPSFYSGGEAEGWVSGTVQMPAECSPGQFTPMTAYECSTCLKSADPAGCLACSKALYPSGTCGYSRSTYYGRTTAEQIADLYRRTCLVCACYSKPSDAADRQRCYEVTKAYGVYDSKDYPKLGPTLTAAAALCPSQTKGTAVAATGR